ncbi:MULTISPECIES: YveK family protein [Bacillus]|uniref:YveK family protein n=1 Tax=Bacillus TaxID=1386 RepID=UPI002155CC6C|nr:MULTISPECIES: Wzz/FepE/Etk N-terminal domain-containing protein [Bacillus]
MTNSKHMNNINEKPAKDINLKELFNVIKKRFWVILVFTILSTSVGIIYSNLNTTYLYQSSTRIIIGADAEYMKTLQVIIRDSTVLEKVIKELDLEKSTGELAGQISVQSIEGSQVVSINVVDSDAYLAADIANTTAKVFKEEIPKIVNFNDVKYLSDAKVNPYPINENKNKTIIIAFLFGLIAGIGLTFFLESLDGTIKSERDIEDFLGLQVLGRVPRMNRKNTKKRSHHKLVHKHRGETIVSK